MRLGDAPRLAEVHVQAWRETYVGMLSDEFLAALRVEDRLAMWSSATPEGMARHWVVEDDGVIVGFAGLNRPAPGAAVELWGLYLLKSHQKLGLGGELLRTALGDRPASLWVAEENANAIAFYQHQGFALEGTRELVADWENLAELRMVR
ncbi:ribosomal protein S18 acetylase RimI-like enzyme [Psychromicrobium silvestre]|uniref:Ribosomal protein S18 acetylase RimI-like enzyme n=1 Tax=Psychromicrobium silvestre TaxID=1645614 RepID=A0A7Y9LUF0_9MICC|nr:GNAT family N-acetyltransferase [Psychromicrobium silvestre]NYE95786.1 ribosomal protein S18 acetylase RimI-like enzyme [Psychromicrobium silvestre]